MCSLEVAQLPHPCLVLKTLSQWMEGSAVGGIAGGGAAPCNEYICDQLAGILLEETLVLLFLLLEASRLARGVSQVQN